MKSKLATPLLIGGAFLLSACAGAGFRSANSWPGLSSDGETVYMAFEQSVYAIDASNGNVKWSYPAEPESGRTFFAPPAVSEDGLVFVGDFENRVVALNASSGAVVWGPIKLGEDNGRIVGGATVAGNVLLVPSGDGRLYARDIADGSAIWTFPAEFSEPLEEAIWSAPVVDGQRVYFTSMDHNVYAVDLAQGRQQWMANRELGGAIADSPVLVDSLVLAGTFGRELIALDENRGREAWTFDAGDWIWGSPAVGDGVAYFGDLAGQLHAVDIRSGSEIEIWKQSLDSRISASLVISEDRIFVAAESGILFARELSTNRELWNVPLDGDLHTAPLVMGDMVVVATNGGEPLLCAFDVKNGTELWSFTPGGSDRRCRAG
ncbi:MAG: PQQ-binding-like beta-propeller repeat protein [Anaerolineales bacterium]